MPFTVFPSQTITKSSVCNFNKLQRKKNINEEKKENIDSFKGEIETKDNIKEPKEKFIDIKSKNINGNFYLNKEK